MLRQQHPSLQHLFSSHRVLYWSNLSRLNNLLVIVNISMFFLTGLVARGHFYTCYSLICLNIVGVAAIVPTQLHGRLWFYWTFMLIEILGLYYLVASVLYWINNG